MDTIIIIIIMIILIMIIIIIIVIIVIIIIIIAKHLSAHLNSQCAYSEKLRLNNLYNLR